MFSLHLLVFQQYFSVTMTSNNIFLFTKDGQVEGFVGCLDIFLPQQQGTARDYYTSFTNEIWRHLS